MLEKLIIVSGVYGTGKTTYAGTFKYPVLHMDDYVSPPSEDIHYSDIKIILDKYSDRTTIIFDTYYFVFYKDLSGLKSIISPTTDIEILMVYTMINEDN